jgi:hypothetical protein
VIYQPRNDVVDERRTVGAETARDRDGYDVGASAQSEKQRALGGPTETVISTVDVRFRPKHLLTGEIKFGPPQNGDVRGRRRGDDRAVIIAIAQAAIIRIDGSTTLEISVII